MRREAGDASYLQGLWEQALSDYVAAGCDGALNKAWEALRTTGENSSIISIAGMESYGRCNNAAP